MKRDDSLAQTAGDKAQNATAQAVMRFIMQRIPCWTSPTILATPWSFSSESQPMTTLAMAVAEALCSGRCGKHSAGPCVHKEPARWRAFLRVGFWFGGGRSGIGRALDRCRPVWKYLIARGKQEETDYRCQDQGCNQHPDC